MEVRTVQLSIWIPHQSVVPVVVDVLSVAVEVTGVVVAGIFAEPVALPLFLDEIQQLWEMWVCVSSLNTHCNGPLGVGGCGGGSS